MADETTNGNASLNDPMNMRNSDTGKLKRIMPQTPAAAGTAAAQQGRRTIKLKPISVAKPSAHSAIPASEMPTASIPIQPIAPAPSAAIPVSATPSSLPGVKQTIKLRPSNVVGGAIPSSAAPSSEAKPASSQTIKLTPKIETQENTTKMARQTIRLVPSSNQTTGTVPNIPGVTPSAQALKLTPSAVPQVTPSAQTLKLTPSAVPQVTPSAQTLKLTPAAGQPTAARTIKLTPSSVKTVPGTMPNPSAPTVNMTNTEVIQQPAMDPAEKPKIMLKKHATEASVPPSVAASPLNAQAPDLAETKTEKSEPSILFTITAVASFLILGYAAYVAFSQFSGLWGI